MPESLIAKLLPALVAAPAAKRLSVRLDANTLAELAAFAKVNSREHQIALNAQCWIRQLCGPQQFMVSYSYGPFTNFKTLRSDDVTPPELHIERGDIVQADSVIGAFFRRMHLNPFADPAEAAGASLRIERASLVSVPAVAHGWQVALCITIFVASFAVGPGVCVWLALSELMPTRIRSNGMSFALLINQFVSTMIAVMFLPIVGEHGYATLFFYGAGCSLLYFLTAAFLLPEPKGKTLEAIEAHFIGKTAK